jgi:ArsR family transcriptional regulator
MMSMIASAEGGEICVCDITPAFEISGPTISHHLKVLKESGLVTAERRASWVYYRARPDLMRQLSALLDTGA